MKAVRPQKPEIRRHFVSRLEQNDVTGNKSVAVNRPSFSAAQDGCFQSEHLADGGHRPTFSILDNPGHTAGDVLTYEHHWRTESNDIRLNIGAQTGDARHATTISTVLFLEVAA